MLSWPIFVAIFKFHCLVEVCLKFLCFINRLLGIGNFNLSADNLIAFYSRVSFLTLVLYRLRKADFSGVVSNDAIGFTWNAATLGVG